MSSRHVVFTNKKQIKINDLFIIFLQNLVLCFRLHFAKDSTTINTAGATVRHLVSHVFERVLLEDDQYREADHKSRIINFEELKTPSNIPPKGIRPCAGDAYLMFQVIVTQNNYVTIWFLLVIMAGFQHQL